MRLPEALRARVLLALHARNAHGAAAVRLEQLYGRGQGARTNYHISHHQHALAPQSVGRRLDGEVHRCARAIALQVRLTGSHGVVIH